jgi:rhodanese-related sulfurtransferase
MKKLLLLFPLVFAAGVFAQSPDAKSPQQAPAFKAHVLSRAELDELLKKPDNLLLIDVRRPDEVTKVGGFPVYLSVQIDSVSSSLAWIPKDRTIVTVSNHAARAGKAADILAAKGFKVAGAVGAETYEKDGGKLAKIAAPPAAAETGGAAR